VPPPLFALITVPQLMHLTLMAGEGGSWKNPNAYTQDQRRSLLDDMAGMLEGGPTRVQK
jgi:hypothetical protein